MEKRKGKGSRSGFTYRGALPSGVGLLLMAPVALLFASVAVMAVAGGSALALLLPLFVRRRLPRTNRDDDCIVLGRDQYSRVDDTPQRLPQR